MADPRWRMLPIPFLVINDVIMTSLLLLKIICVLALLLSNFCSTSTLRDKLRQSVNQVMLRSWK